jgi:hypothetical protein
MYKGYVHLKDESKGIEITFDEHHYLLNQNEDEVQFLQFSKIMPEGGRRKDFVFNTAWITYIEFEKHQDA